MVDVKSFQEVEGKLVAELKEHAPNVPIVLVGTKIDLRDDKEFLQQLEQKGEKPISYEEGVALAKKIKAFGYVENSSKTRIGVEETIAKGIESTFEKKEKTHNEQSSNCVLQ